jgi:sugar lactone lactonase YvrE
MKWLKDATEGIVVAGGNSKGNSLSQLSFPQGVIVDHFGQIYVADMDNHRVMRWFAGDTEGTIVVGGNGEGKEVNQLCLPAGLSFDKEGNLYVADWENNRIQKFEIDSNTNNLFN